MIDRYRGIIEAGNGTIHRQEDWGRRQLAYQINKIHKAHYVLLNIETERDTLQELESAFRFNDAVLRFLTIKRDEAVTEMSPLAKEAEQEAERERERDARNRARAEEAQQRASNELKTAEAGDSADTGETAEGASPESAHVDENDATGATANEPAVDGASDGDSEDRGATDSEPTQSEPRE
jgi:small subunit ribosomal protein S6